MQVYNVNRKSLRSVGEIQLQLAYDQHSLNDFIHRAHKIENYGSQIEEKENSFSVEKRMLLAEVLERQYHHVKNSPHTLIQELKEENTFTVTTGHQMCLFTGPLYFVIKILHTIRLAESLSKEYPEFNFIPVYWMASEDHDFEEIQSANIFNQQIKWESKQSGPVGRFETKDIEVAKEIFSSFFDNNPDSDVHRLLSSLKGATYSEAFRSFIHTLFSDYNLLIIDGDDPVFKELFLPVMRKEITGRFSEGAVNEVSEKLKSQGYKLQVNPRSVNLFYMKQGLRSRIEVKNNGFHIDGVGDFPTEMLLDKLEQHPERFSPNVILRPLYQEMILPNLAYVGGGGELAYWLQLKGVFNAVDVPYPILVLRNSVIWIDRSTMKKMDKIGMSIDDLFVDVEIWKKEHVKEQETESLDFNEMNEQLGALENTIRKSVNAVDPGMKQYAEAELTRIHKTIDSIKDKLLKRSKSKHAETLKHAEAIHASLFPNGQLQERSVNFFGLAPDGKYNGTLDSLYSGLRPFESDFLLFVDDNSIK